MASKPLIGAMFAALEPRRRVRQRRALRALISPLFDVDWYLVQNPDVRATGVNPIDHYLDFGAAERRNPSPYFHTAFYLDLHADVASSGQNPLVHFAQFGWKEGRRPNLLFDPEWYLQQNPDVFASGMNPLRHYFLHGFRERRSPHPLVHVDWYLERHPDITSPEQDLLLYLLAAAPADRGDPHPLFRSEWYLERNCDVSNAGIDPLVHFLSFGGAEGRRPHPLFDSQWYLDNNPDVREANHNPLVHYLKFGAREGRDPNPHFDTDWYVANTPGVTENPLVHYCLVGAASGRDPSGVFNTSTYLEAIPPEKRLGNPLETFLKESEGAPVRRASDPRSLINRCAGRPTILMVTHNAGGGTEIHVRELAARIRGRVNILVAKPANNANDVSIVQSGSEESVAFATGDQRELMEFLRMCNVARVHVHHASGHESYLQTLVDDLGVPFDLTLHDYFILSAEPHLTDEAGRYCEPGAARLSNPQSAGAGRLERLRWLYEKADRVIAPSHDIANRFNRYLGPARTVLAAHPEPFKSVSPVAKKLPPGRPLKIGILGTLSARKGLAILADVARRANARGRTVRFALIGQSVSQASELWAAGVHCTGPYDRTNILELIVGQKVDALWYPIQSPEPYSYTLSEGLASGLPLIVPDIGAFAERTADRDWVWVRPWNDSPADWLSFFEGIRRENFMLGRPPRKQGAGWDLDARFYDEAYLAPVPA